MQHQDKIALVTGGSRGLGREIALRLAQGGADVIVTYREREKDGEAVVAAIQALGRQAAALPLDVARADTFTSFLRRLEEVLAATWKRKTFDFLINNAGINARAAFADTTEETFDRLLNVHFRGVFFLTQRLLPLIADGGRIINTSTGLARFSVPGYAAYASMKGAIEVLTRYLAKELGPRRISVNVVAPGIIETDFTRDALAHAGAREFLSANIALGRVGVPEDISGVVSFLCSEDGRWVNAQRVEASGGMFL